MRWLSKGCCLVWVDLLYCALQYNRGVSCSRAKGLRNWLRTTARRSRGFFIWLVSSRCSTRQKRVSRRKRFEDTVQLPVEHACSLLDIWSYFCRPQTNSRMNELTKLQVDSEMQAHFCMSNRDYRRLGGRKTVAEVAGSLERSGAIISVVSNVISRQPFTHETPKSLEYHITRWCSSYNDELGAWQREISEKRDTFSLKNYNHFEFRNKTDLVFKCGINSIGASFTFSIINIYSLWIYTNKP